MTHSSGPRLTPSSSAHDPVGVGRERRQRHDRRRQVVHHVGAERSRAEHGRLAGAPVDGEQPVEVRGRARRRRRACRARAPARPARPAPCATAAAGSRRPARRAPTAGDRPRRHAEPLADREPDQQPHHDRERRWRGRGGPRRRPRRRRRPARGSGRRYANQPTTTAASAAGAAWTQEVAGTERRACSATTRFVRFDTGSTVDASDAISAGMNASATGSSPWRPGDADVQRRQQHDRGIEVEQHRHRGGQRPTARAAGGGRRRRARRRAAKKPTSSSTTASGTATQQERQRRRQRVERRRRARTAATTPATSATTATPAAASHAGHPTAAARACRPRPARAPPAARSRRRRYRRLATAASAATLSGHLAGVAQRLEPQPSKLVVRVRFPSPAPSSPQLRRHVAEMPSGRCGQRATLVPRSAGPSLPRAADDGCRTADVRSSVMRGASVRRLTPRAELRSAVWES